MEYGLRIATPESALTSPREWCAAKWGGDAQRYDYPDAPLTALYFGSEFCQELLPGIGATEAFCAHCDTRSLEAVLLTPIVTYKGLGRIDRLLGNLTGRGWFPAVVCNDWGVLELLRKSYPCLPLRMGRLMNRGLRDPRLAMQDMGSGGENTARGAGVRKLAAALGVCAVETDADLEPGYLGIGDDGFERTLHVPFTFVASGRNCLEKAAAMPAGRGVFTAGLKSGCKAPCRGVCRRENRPDTQRPLWRAGNSLFFTAPPEWVSRHLALVDRLVLHQRPMP
jgi:hypothetical protein